MIRCLGLTDPQALYGLEPLKHFGADEFLGDGPAEYTLHGTDPAVDHLAGEAVRDPRLSN
jgi:hypothetical protein